MPCKNKVIPIIGIEIQCEQKYLQILLDNLKWIIEMMIYDKKHSHIYINIRIGQWMDGWSTFLSGHRS